jgi:hypothetical protein
MLDFEQDVTEEVTENVEQPTEEAVEVEQEEKKFTQSEVSEMIRSNVSRKEAKLRKQFERETRKYKELEDILRAGTGKESVDEMTGTFRDFYEKKGINVPKAQKYTDREIEVLAKSEADDIIGLGFEEVVEEVDRLTAKGFDRMDAKEKQMFKRLAEYRKDEEEKRDLAKLGVTEDVYNSKEFKEFAGKFNPNTPITDIFNIYNKMKPKKEVRTMGSMKSSQAPKVKDFYTEEEIARLTEDDLNDEDVWNAVRRSMTGRR